MLGAESGLKISERRRNRVTRLYSNPSKGAICCYAVKHRIGELKPLWLHRDRKKIQRKVREHWHWLRKFQTIEVSKVDSEMFYLKKGTLLLTPHNHYHGTTSLTNGTIGHLIYLDRHSELNFLDNKITYDNWVRFLLKQGVRVYWVTLNSPTEIEERLYPDVRNYPNFKVFSKYPSQVAAGIDEISKYVEGRRVRISIDTDFANSLNDLLDTLQYISSVLRYEIETIEVYFDPILFKEKSEIRRIVNRFFIAPKIQVTPQDIKDYYNLFIKDFEEPAKVLIRDCLLYTSPSPRDLSTSRMPSSA